MIFTKINVIFIKNPNRKKKKCKIVNVNITMGF
ncbi:hypothetical protein SIFV0073 [Sulfolobus islandicus filamentous virus]|uniref:Uncharacterized protein 73 n=1 Tax=Sulfolobus islandicus filamentous virus (isolate Iceland/Hveragerdi) TaxID=654908 RepID=Y073_SIFVH|nr:hypothetical protein SIFV0073 [Sulfolobus islandicus filamentous virus]Q914F9.1 RecName: Full=Uncharacterized protein 73 [Sulfolobus islandicus filamentous virus (isolate Hveragerdi)]AAL27782.1 hypothetical protein [Sulfolobus islandicus filamentous virus]